MLITRWQAQAIPTKEQMKLILHSEGMEVSEEHFEAGSEIPDHKHPFEEIRMIVSGSMIFNFTGNKIILRAGDKIVIPPNTMHSMEIQSDSECASVLAYRPF